ncbi:hypothetical protein YPPY66_5144 [Yersinia pestis PY-66]|uniref:Uncharacterized protein n=2 Tax=Yersinia pestis TaxID=632 RepID=E8PSB7_YERPE|nr:hypothetical protein YPJ_pPCP19 [Yersinia pestis Java 9]EDR59490.1 hypothetical protein YpUG050454_1866 [Yersinia pestis biovar Antiqua str. UG05-0454]EIQ95229.1 hypothetical protein YPPY01_0035 [Yersinia pestis PY-01]EIQ96419.1 hypothetical protein YPPY02_4760 [Yersinia pestis PY-02]EIQ96901.1 hypothetical protein YPPY05_4890 [Yersinia pestis PY-05]EIQ99829.1 hypothetical protein YPPY03_4923 [Yersinia pestis PY-03]EIR10429.1 hypothetical protein YPPY04_4784 [Yersinia pestis PY-04]EIR1246
MTEKIKRRNFITVHKNSGFMYSIFFNLLFFLCVKEEFLCQIQW